MLTIDIAGSLAKLITPSYGVSDQDLLALRSSMKRYIEEMRSECDAGEHPWARSAFDEEAIRGVREAAERIKKEKIETILWIGLGGSGLGPRVIKEVFESPDTPELVIVDTIDPTTLQ